MLNAPGDARKPVRRGRPGGPMAMTGFDAQALNRRGFLQAGATATAAALAMPTTGRADDPPASKATLPTRKRGNTGVEVTILNQGTWRSSGLDRILRFAYASGIRYFD